MVPVELQSKVGQKVFYTPVWRVSKSEAAALAYPEVQKFEALIERAKSGDSYCVGVEVEMQGPFKPVIFPRVRIHLPPAKSQQQTRFRHFRHGGFGGARNAAVNNTRRAYPSRGGG